MKSIQCLALCALLAVSSGMVLEQRLSQQGDKTITKVVKLLQGMLDKSVKEGDEEREIYGKFKCYCDTSEAEKRASVKQKTEQIALLESQIEEIQGETGELSSDCAELKTSMADNKAARDEATTIRNKENKAFKALQTDLVNAIAQMKSAIETLAAVGADQTKSTGADNKQFMAGHKASLVSLGADVKEALNAASAIMSPEQRKISTAFLQAPFTGTYTSQSAQVIGIVKNMRDTFKTNLGDARKTEKNSQEEFDDFITVKTAAFKEMKQSYEDKQKDLAGNDKELSGKKKALANAEKQKSSDEAFLDKLVPMCEEKAKGFENRNMLRANEEAAIAEAISILNSDEAFATFGTTDATSTGGTTAGTFIQLRSVRRHLSGGSHARQLAQKVVQQAAKDTHSTRLFKVLASLKAENPFDEVLTEIANMITVIDDEGKADKTKLDWCNKERTENKATVKRKEKEITALDSQIDKLEKSIDHPKTGYKALIQETDDNLLENDKSQKEETADRTEENVAYQKDVSNLVAAEGILKKALKVLKAYYDDLEAKLAAGEALVQEDPKAPEAWKGDGDYAGQSSKGGDIIGMLEYIMKEGVKEQMEAHKDEEKAQADYEDSMTKLKKDQAAAEKRKVNYIEKLAEAEKNLLDAQEDLKDTTKDKEETEAYLLKIKPGCDFITTNFDLRNTNRATEKKALNKAINLIKKTPAYKTAVTEATNESYGDCKSCVKNKNHVKCKACMADVTIPAFCAGHKGTKGC